MAGNKPDPIGAPRRDDYALNTVEFYTVLEMLRAHLTSSLGHSWLASCNPLSSREEILRALGETKEIGQVLATSGRPPLTGFFDCREWLAGLASGGKLPREKDFGELLSFLMAQARVRGFLARVGVGCPELAKLGQEMPDLEAMANRLAQIVDERGEIQDRASSRLYGIRAELGSAEARLQQAVRGILSDRKVTRCLQSTQVSWRGGRPVLQVKAESRGRVPGILHDRSQSGATVFVEPEQVVAPANAVTDLRAQESAEVSRLLAELTRDVAQGRRDILHATELVGRFDFICAKGFFAAKYGMTVPELAASWPLRVRGARHPILVKSHLDERGDLDGVIPLDLTLGEAFDSLIVTGPNTGGKTVALKSLGLVVAMTMAGLPVFATLAEVPLVDGVYADIGDEQEIAQNLSTFSGHLQRIVAILKRATAKSLVLLDELGAGTDPAEGGVLGYAILEALLQKNVKVLATTHLGVLKTFALHNSRAENGAMEFDPRTLEPLFRLCVGLPGTSNALVIARRMGMPEGVVSRAEEMLDRPESGMEFLVEKLQESRLAAEASRRQAESLEQAAAEGLARIKEQEKVLDIRASAMAEQASRVAEDCLKNAKAELHRLLQPLQGVPGSHGERVRQLGAGIENLLAWSPLADQREEFFAQLRRGDTIRIPRFRFRGPVRKIDRKREILDVLLEGGLKMTVSFADVIPDDEM